MPKQKYRRVRPGSSSASAEQVREVSECLGFNDKTPPFKISLGYSGPIFSTFLDSDANSTRGTATAHADAIHRSIDSMRTSPFNSLHLQERKEFPGLADDYRTKTHSRCPGDRQRVEAEAAIRLVPVRVCSALRASNSRACRRASAASAVSSARPSAGLCFISTSPRARRASHSSS